MGNKRSFVRRGAKFGIEGETVTRESTRHQGTVKSEEFEKRRTREWRQTAAAKVRVGPKNKPFLGTRTTKVKYWEKHQLKIYKKMINEPEDSDMHWQDPVQFYGIIYRFWFLHSHMFFACEEQLILAIREVWRAVKSGMTKTHLTLYEVRSACYQLRGNYIRLKDLIKLVGPGILPRANVTTVSLFTGIDDITEFVHRIPIPAIKQAMAGIWERKLNKDRRERGHSNTINGMQGTFKGNAYVATRATTKAICEAIQMGKFILSPGYRGDDWFEYRFKWAHQMDRRGKNMVFVKLCKVAKHGLGAGTVVSETTSRAVNGTIKCACLSAVWAAVMELLYQEYDIETQFTYVLARTRRPVVSLIPSARFHVMCDYIRSKGRIPPTEVLDGMNASGLSGFQGTEYPTHPFDYRALPMRLLFHGRVASHGSNSSLNGSHGEHTNSDDVEASEIDDFMNETIDEFFCKVEMAFTKVGSSVFSCCFRDRSVDGYGQAPFWALSGRRCREEDSGDDSDYDDTEVPLPPLQKLKVIHKSSSSVVKVPHDVLVSETMEQDYLDFLPMCVGESESDEEVYNGAPCAKYFPDPEDDDGLPGLIEDSSDDEDPGEVSHYLSEDDADSNVVEETPVVGAGKNKGKGGGGNGKKGQSFVANAVKNKGKGGASKQNKDMPAHPPEVVNYANAVAAGLDNPGAPPPEEEGVPPEEVPEPISAGDKRKNLRTNYLASKHIGKRTVHRNPAEANGGIFDGLGAPFCGVTAIDLAVGITPNVDHYLNMLEDGDLDDIPTVIGDSLFLKDYAYSKGVNLRINVPGEGPRDYDNGFQGWAVLLYQGAIAKKVEEGEEQDIPVGHYVVQYSNQASIPTYIANDPPRGCSSGWLTGRGFAVTLDARIRRILKTTESVYDKIELAVMSSTLASIVTMGKYLAGPTGIVSAASAATIVSVLGSLYAGYRFGRVILESMYIDYTTNFLEKRLSYDDFDKRQIMFKRDDIEHQDYVTKVEIFGDVVLDCFGEQYKLWELDREEVIMSDALYVNGLSAMEAMGALGKDPYTAAVEVVRYRNVNYPAGSGIVNGTYRVLRVASYGIDVGAPVGNDFAGVVAFAAPGAAAVIPDIAVAAANQVAGVDLMRIVGAGAQFEPDMPNHVIKYRLVPDEDETKPVGIYPIGPLYTDDGLVGPGFFATTNSINTLTAFVGRAMTKEKTVSPLIVDFLESSMKFLDYYIDSVDLTGVDRRTNVEVFRTHYTGKRPTNWIDTRVWEYERFCAGLMSPSEGKKYRRKGFFVKFEHNAKNGAPRQRGIMTMSGQMLIECCPILGIIEAWNHGDFSRYQVKGMTPEETAKKIMEYTNEFYSVSDYSAFESSIDVYLRCLEEYVIRKLLERAGMEDVWQCYVEHAGGNRILNTRWGSFIIGTRCSGDFWTSFGNGIVNVCAMHFCCELRGFPFFKMLAEGDDGLLPSKMPDERILAELGLKFSSAQSGTADGDCDFLRKRVVDGKFYLSIGKVMTSLLMVKNGHILKKSGQLSILRCMAHSVYHQSPGHPVLTALVNRIWYETRGYVTPRKTIYQYFDAYEGVNITDPGMKYAEVDETMRAAIATGAHGFDPMPVCVQLELERRFSEGFFYVGNLLKGDPDFDVKNECTVKEGLTLGNVLYFAEECDEIEFSTTHKGAFQQSCDTYRTF